MPSQFTHSAAATTLFLPVFASAADAAAPDFGGSVLQLIFGMIVVLGLLFATLWVLKKLSGARGTSGRLVRVVSAAAVGPRERVVLVDVGGKRLVLGVAPGHISLLDTQMAEPETASEQADIMNAVPNAVPAFSHWLQKTLAKRNEK